MGPEPMLTQREKTLYQMLWGGSNSRCCITQDSEPSTLSTKLFQPLESRCNWWHKINNQIFSLSLSSLFLPLFLCLPSSAPLSVSSLPPPPWLFVSPSVYSSCGPSHLFVPETLGGQVCAEDGSHLPHGQLVPADAESLVHVVGPVLQGVQHHRAQVFHTHHVQRREAGGDNWK